MMLYLYYEKLRYIWWNNHFVLSIPQFCVVSSSECHFSPWTSLCSWQLVCGYPGVGSAPLGLIGPLWDPRAGIETDGVSSQLFRSTLHFRHYIHSSVPWPKFDYIMILKCWRLLAWYISCKSLSITRAFCRRSWGLSLHMAAALRQSWKNMHILDGWGTFLDQNLHY